MAIPTIYEWHRRYISTKDELFRTRRERDSVIAQRDDLLAAIEDWQREWDLFEQMFLTSPGIRAAAGNIRAISAKAKAQ